jgi:hypothetical protein
MDLFLSYLTGREGIIPMGGTALMSQTAWLFGIGPSKNHFIHCDKSVPVDTLCKKKTTEQRVKNPPAPFQAHEQRIMHPILISGACV